MKSRDSETNTECIGIDLLKSIYDQTLNPREFLINEEEGDTLIAVYVTRALVNLDDAIFETTENQ